MCSSYYPYTVVADIPARMFGTRDLQPRDQPPQPPNLKWEGTPPLEQRLHNHAKKDALLRARAPALQLFYLPNHMRPRAYCFAVGGCEIAILAS